MTETLKDRTVCFTGHRIIEGTELCSMRTRLYSTVMSLVSEGYDTFVCGGAMGFDTEAAECVISIRERCPHIRLLLFLPCRDQTVRWKSTSLIARYKAVLGAADGVDYVSDFYSDGCMLTRNRRMVDAASVCIAYMRKMGGGTGYTVRRAGKCGLRVINLYDENDKDKKDKNDENK